MSCNRCARGLAAISVVALAAGLFVSSVGISPLFADEVSTNGSDANRVIELGAADDGDGSFAPNNSTVLSSEGRSEDSSTTAVESADGTTPQDAESVEDLAVKTRGRFLMVRPMFLIAAIPHAKCGTLRADLPQMALMFRCTTRI